MVFESGSEWPQKLRPALLAGNILQDILFLFDVWTQSNAVHLFKYHGSDFHDDSQAENDSFDTMQSIQQNMNLPMVHQSASNQSTKTV